MSTLSSQIKSKQKENSLPTSKILMGQISFINTLPVILPLSAGYVQADCSFEFGTPKELNDKLEKNELQLGAMSSYYFLSQNKYDIFPEISISGTGKVGSVLLFSRLELSELDGKIIEVPASSASSIKLLEVLLKDEYGVEPLLRLETESSKMSTEADAVLLIGDKALTYDTVCQKELLRVDLAQWWYRRFSLPFVFGVWGARREWVQNNQSEFKQINRALLESCRLGLTDLFQEVLKEASKRTGLNEDRLSCYYLDELDYTLTGDHNRALSLFGELCRKYGHIET